MTQLLVAHASSKTKHTENKNLTPQPFFFWCNQHDYLQAQLYLTPALPKDWESGGLLELREECSTGQSLPQKKDYFWHPTRWQYFREGTWNVPPLSNMAEWTDTLREVPQLTWSNAMKGFQDDDQHTELHSEKNLRISAHIFPIRIHVSPRTMYLYFRIRLKTSSGWRRKR